MVWNSANADVANRHQGLAQLLKEKRAEGHFAGTNLDPGIRVYDQALPAHARSVQQLGLSVREIPLICLTELDAKGIPVRVLWKSSYANADGALAAVDVKLGIADRNRPKVPPQLVLVGSPGHPAYRETRAKLEALLQGAWKAAPIRGGLQLQESLADVPSPGLAMVDPDTHKLMWKKALDKPDVALQVVGQRLGITYVPPDRLHWEADGSELCRVSGGKVAIGTNQGEPDNRPLHLVDLQPYYYMGRTEVTNAQFERFVKATNYVTDAERAERSFVFTGGQFASVPGANWRRPYGSGSSTSPDHPVVHITFNDANAYCNWAGLRLPSEQEWEWAAGGKIFPWGSEWLEGACRSSVKEGQFGAISTPAPVASYPQDRSPWGLQDMAGNVCEWTSSLYLPYTPESPRTVKMNGLRRVIRGGTFADSKIVHFDVRIRTGVGAQDATCGQGFRVCLDGSTGHR